MFSLESASRHVRWGVLWKEKGGQGAAYKAATAIHITHFWFLVFAACSKPGGGGGSRGSSHGFDRSPSTRGTSRKRRKRSTARPVPEDVLCILNHVIETITVSRGESGTGGNLGMLPTPPTCGVSCVFLGHPLPLTPQLKLATIRQHVVD